MHKKYAIALLGGRPCNAASAIGISDVAVCQWPEQLTERIEARVWFAFNKLPNGVKRKNRAAAESLKVVT